jgi:uncharacterized protein (DUF1778 family)
MRSANETRVQIRTNEEEKDYLVRAARRCGFKTLSEFMRVSAHEKAKRDLKDFPELEDTNYKTPTEPRKLSLKDSQVFAQSIINPPEPNEKLKNLMSEEKMASFQKALKELLPPVNESNSDAMLKFLSTEEGKALFRKALEEAQKKSGI